jgi:hypothetical protein
MAYRCPQWAWPHVGYAVDRFQNLSSTPSTSSIGVGGVDDRWGSRSLAEATDAARCRWRRQHVRSRSLAEATRAVPGRWLRRDSLSAWRESVGPGWALDPPQLRRSGVDALSSPSPRSTGWTDRGVNVGLSGRGVPPPTHADAFGRNTRTQLAHNDASGPRIRGSPDPQGGSTPTWVARVKLGAGAAEPKPLALARKETPERPLTSVPHGLQERGARVVRHRAFGPRQSDLLGRGPTAREAPPRPQRPPAAPATPATSDQAVTAR